MEVKLRTANKSDCDLLFSWANDTGVRENSFNTNKILYSEHIDWFTSKLESDKSFIFICCIENEPIGQVRLDIVEESGMIDFSVAKESRGKGYGSTILLKLVEIIVSEKMRIRKLIGRVKFSNIPSQKSFVKAGFKSSICDEYIEYYKLLDTKK